MHRKKKQTWLNAGPALPADDNAVVKQGSKEVSCSDRLPDLTSLERNNLSLPGYKRLDVAHAVYRCNPALDM
eukprot:3857779-Amphidinium_carterae.1